MSDIGVPASSFLIQQPSEAAGGTSSAWIPVADVRDQNWVVLASAWLSPGYWRHLESEPVSISLSAFQINNFFSVRKNGLICSLFSMVLESLPFHSPEFFYFSLVYLGSGAIYGWWPQQFWYGRILGKRDIRLVLINLCLAGDTSRLRMLEHKDTGVCVRGGEGDVLMLGHQGGGNYGDRGWKSDPLFQEFKEAQTPEDLVPERTQGKLSSFHFC